MSKQRDKALAITNMVFSGMSFDEVVNAYFTNNGEQILRLIAKNSKDPEAMYKHLEEFSYEISKENGESDFGNIQRNIVAELPTINEIYIIDNPKEIGETNVPNMDAARLVFEQEKNNNIGGMSKTA